MTVYHSNFPWRLYKNETWVRLAELEQKVGYSEVQLSWLIATYRAKKGRITAIIQEFSRW